MIEAQIALRLETPLRNVHTSFGNEGEVFPMSCNWSIFESFVTSLRWINIQILPLTRL